MDRQEKMKMYDRIYPGKKWLDTAGKPIQVHGFSVFRNEEAGLWYWYGENKEKTVGGRKNTIWHWGVRLYTSSDLYNWEDRGLIIEPQPEELFSPLHPTYCMDRPHILYNKKTGKYVAWLKIMAGEVSQFMSVLTADRFEGPYTFVRKIFQERLSVLAAPRMVRSTFHFARLRSAGGVYLSGGLKPATETSRILTYPPLIGRH